jgi:hypothetical protein
VWRFRCARSNQVAFACLCDNLDPVAQGTRRNWRIRSRLVNQKLISGVQTSSEALLYLAPNLVAIVFELHASK